MRLIFLFPDDLCAIFLTKWLSIRDIAKLDSAVCQNKNDVRTAFVALAYRDNVVYDNPFREGMKFNKHNSTALSNFNASMLTRQVRIPRVIVSESFEIHHPLRRRFLDRCGRHITSVSYDESRDTPAIDWKLVLSDLCEYCPGVVHIRCRTHFGQEEYTRIAQTWPHLKHFVPAVNCTTTYLGAIAEHCHALTHLVMPGAYEKLTVEDVQALIERNPALTHLELGKPEQYLFRYRFINFMPKLISTCCNLKCLRLFVAVQDETALTAIAHACPRLEILQFHVPRSNHSDNSTSMCTIASRGLLTELSLCNVWVDEAACAEIAQRSVNLTYLSMLNTGMDDAALHILLQCCPRLQVLDVSECDAVTVVGMRAVAQGFANLQLLNIEHCNVTQTEMSAFLDAAPKSVEIVICKRFRGEFCGVCYWDHNR